MTANSASPRVVVLGGGFAGLSAARALKDANVDVVLVDQHNYHTFQPLLYQVATDLLETTIRARTPPRWTGEVAGRRKWPAPITPPSRQVARIGSSLK